MMIDIINKTNNMQTTSIHYTLVSQFMEELNKNKTKKNTCTQKAKHTFFLLFLSNHKIHKIDKNQQESVLIKHITVHIEIAR